MFEKLGMVVKFRTALVYFLVLTKYLRQQILEMRKFYLACGYGSYRKPRKTGADVSSPSDKDLWYHSRRGHQVLKQKSFASLGLFSS